MIECHNENASPLQILVVNASPQRPTPYHCPQNNAAVRDFVCTVRSTRLCRRTLRRSTRDSGHPICGSEWRQRRDGPGWLRRRGGYGVWYRVVWGIVGMHEQYSELPYHTHGRLAGRKAHCLGPNATSRTGRRGDIQWQGEAGRPGKHHHRQVRRGVHLCTGRAACCRVGLSRAGWPLLRGGAWGCCRAQGIAGG